MRKFAGLELLRFLAAVAVLVWHYQHFFYDVPAGDPTRYDVGAQPLYLLLAPAYRHGTFAVQIFWAISGFIFFFRYGAAIHERRVGVRQYLVFRFSRLYPLHALTLLLVALLQLAFMRVNGGGPFVYPHYDWTHFTLNVLMISQWGLQKGFSFNGPAWSVSVEEFCYLAFFFIASGMAMSRRNLALLPLAAGVLLFTHPLTPEFGECLALFLVGGAMWGAHGWVLEGGPARRRGALGLLVASTLGLAAGWSTYPGLPAEAQLAVTHLGLIPTILGWSLAASPPDGSWAGRRCGDLGKLTYSTYMIHFPLQLAAVSALDALGVSRGVFYALPAFLLFVSSVLALGWGLFTWFEMPLQARLRARLLPAHASPG